MPLNIRLAAGIYHRGRHIIYIYISNYLHIHVCQNFMYLCVKNLMCLYVYQLYTIQLILYVYIYILQIGPEVSAGMQGCGDEH